MEKDNNKNAYTDQIQDLFSDKKTKKKIDLHLSDINDTISDDDIKNVITDISSSAPVAGATKNNKLPKDNSSSDDEVPQVPTAWNIID